MAVRATMATMTVSQLATRQPTCALSAAILSANCALHHPNSAHSAGDCTVMSQIVATVSQAIMTISRKINHLIYQKNIFLPLHLCVPNQSIINNPPIALEPLSTVMFVQITCVTHAKQTYQHAIAAQVKIFILLIKKIFKGTNRDIT